MKNILLLLFVLFAGTLSAFSQSNATESPSPYEIQQTHWFCDNLANSYQLISNVRGLVSFRQEYCALIENARQQSENVIIDLASGLKAEVFSIDYLQSHPNQILNQVRYEK